jgi:hypothetical protein
MLLAQTPGLNEAINAAQPRGWEAVVLVVLILGGFSFFGFMFRKYADSAEQREQRLSGRVTHLEDLIRERLFTTIDSNAQLIGRLVEATAEIVAVCREMRTALAALESRPCMAMETAERLKLVESLVCRYEEPQKVRGTKHDG